VSEELPEILSDEEFARMLQERDKASRPLRTEYDWWVKPTMSPSDGLPESTIEQNFPRIAQKLALIWPSEACATYLTSLIVNERGPREGFPAEVIEDLLMLHSINDMILRSFRTRSAPSSLSDKLPPRF
jgi:hypothetical protein